MLCPVCHNLAVAIPLASPAHAEGWLPAPSNAASSVASAGRGLPRALVVALIVTVLVMAAAGTTAYLLLRGANSPTSAYFASGCPGHWHATFGVFVPDAEGQPVALDFASPIAGNGQRYYQLNVDPKMSIAVHMHQSGAEQGNQHVAASQFHYESSGKCIGIKASLATLDVDVTTTSLTVDGAHGLAQAGTWTEGSSGAVHVYLESQDATSKAWAWHEVPASEALGHQPGPGQSFMVAFGSYSEAQITAMESQVPAALGHT